MSLASALFASFAMLGWAWSITFAWVMLLVLGHVAANFWGSQTFRPDALRPDDDHPRPPRRLPAPRAARPEAIRLRHHTAIDRFRVVLTAVCAVACGIVGTIFWATACWEQASLAAVAVWLFSSAVIGGFAGFVFSGVLAIAAIRPGETARPAPPWQSPPERPPLLPAPAAGGEEHQ